MESGVSTETGKEFFGLYFSGGINYINPKKERFKIFTHNSNNPDHYLTILWVIFMKIILVLSGLEQMVAA